MLLVVSLAEDINANRLVPLTMLVLNRFLNVSMSSPWREQASFAFGFLFDDVSSKKTALSAALTEP